MLRLKQQGRHLRAFAKRRRGSQGESGEASARKLAYITFADGLSIVIVALSALSIYLAYGITKISSGAPRAWYLIIAGFVVLLIKTVIDLYLDIISPLDLIDATQAVTTLVIIVFFVLGLFALHRTFRRQLKISQESAHSS